MKILNLDHLKSRGFEKVLNTEKTYWIEFVTHEKDLYNVFKNIPKYILHSIITGDVFLVVSNHFECFETMPKIMYEELIIKNNIPEDKIIFLSGNKDIQKIVSITVYQLNQETNDRSYKEVTSKYFNWHELWISHKYKTSSKRYDFKRQLALKGMVDYKKHFLLLNRRWRTHRTTLVGLLQSRDLLNYGYISLRANDDNKNWSNSFEECLHLNNNKEIYNLLISNKEKIISTPELILDLQNEFKENLLYTESLNYYYETSFCSVVTETYFYNFDTVFLTEKTFKPIAYKQPFIVVSVPYTLAFLRELGYKTFHPLIDESYDLEKNDSTRMLMILNEIEKICKLSQQELKEFSKEFYDICNHNQKKLQSHTI